MEMQENIQKYFETWSCLLSPAHLDVPFGTLLHYVTSWNLLVFASGVNMMLAKSTNYDGTLVEVTSLKGQCLAMRF